MHWISYYNLNELESNFVLNDISSFDKYNNSLFNQKFTQAYIITRIK